MSDAERDKCCIDNQRDRLTHKLETARFELAWAQREFDLFKEQYPVNAENENSSVQ